MELDPSGKPFPQLKNDIVIRAASGEPVERVPIWMMRQAGRYLPEFRELGAKYTFPERCSTPSIATEITLMPMIRYDLDAAIIFSDILVIPHELGCEITWCPGPQVPNPIKMNEPWKERLSSKDFVKKASFVYEAITMTRHALQGKAPLYGFAGAPWTLMCYMTGGRSDKFMVNPMKWIICEPDSAKEFLHFLADVVIIHLVEQVKAGAQLLQIFESHPELLNLELFQEFCYAEIKRICLTVKTRIKELGIAHVPIGVIAKGAPFAFHLLCEPDNGIDIVCVDWSMEPEQARRATSKCLSGNFHQDYLMGSTSMVTTKALEMVKRFGRQNLIVNLGNGITPHANVESVKALVEAVHSVD